MIIQKKKKKQAKERKETRVKVTLTRGMFWSLLLCLYATATHTLSRLKTIVVAGQTQRSGSTRRRSDPNKKDEYFQVSRRHDPFGQRPRPSSQDPHHQILRRSVPSFPISTFIARSVLFRWGYVVDFHCNNADVCPPELLLLSAVGLGWVILLCVTVFLWRWFRRNGNALESCGLGKGVWT